MPKVTHAATTNRVVAAAGVAAKVQGNANLGRMIEAAMAKAYTDAVASGVTDPQKQRELMQAARQRTKADYYSQQG